jgi:hypothetical protein
VSALGPGRPIAADDDETAIEKARGYVDGLDWMLCDGTRIVKKVEDKK